MLLERQRVERDVAGRALELEGLGHPVRSLVAVEHAVEAPGVLAVLVDEPPAAARAGVPRVDHHLVLARPHPLHEELRVRIGLEYEIPRRVELAAHIDERDALGGADPGLRHRSILQSPGSMTHSVGSAADAGGVGSAWRRASSASRRAWLSFQ